MLYWLSTFCYLFPQGEFHYQQQTLANLNASPFSVFHQAIVPPALLPLLQCLSNYVWLKQKAEKGKSRGMGKKGPTAVVLNSTTVLKKLSVLILISPTHNTIRKSYLSSLSPIKFLKFCSTFREPFFPSYFLTSLMDSKAIWKEKVSLFHLLFPLSCYASFLIHFLGSYTSDFHSLSKLLLLILNYRT